MFESVLGKFHVLDGFANPWNHAEQILHVAHLFDLLDLFEEVLQIELVFGDFLLEPSGFFGVDLLLSFFDQGNHIAHPQDSVGHTVRSLESEILESVSGGTRLEDDVSGRLTRTLDEINRLRSVYETELARQGAESDGDRNSVFVSSTSRDLERHRAAVRAVIDRLDLKFIGMEDFAAEGTPPATMIQRKVVESQVYLGILGMRYGYVDDVTGLSMTELEYRQAIASDKDIRVFVMDEDAPITGAMVERDPGNLEKLNSFRETVLKSHSCGMFRSEDDLAEKVERTLGAR